jgi:hypothetical protein
MNQRVIRHRKPGTLLDAIAASLQRGPVPDGALGWNIYAGSAEPAFVGFVPAADLDGKLEVIADGLVAEIESEQP